MPKRNFLAVAVLLGGLVAAAPCFSQAAATSPDVIKARDALDSWNWDRAPLEEASRHLESALAKNPKDPDALYELARLHIMAQGGGNEQALQLIKQILQIDPDYLEAYVLLGHVLTNYGRIVEAREALATARRKGSTSAWLDLNLATLSLRDGNYKAAAGYCNTVLERDDISRKARLYAYQCRRDQLQIERNWAQVESDFQAELALTPDSSTTLSSYAQYLCMYRGECEKARPYAERALENGRSVYAEQVLAGCLYFAWGKAAAEHGITSAKAEAFYAEAQSLVGDLDSAMLLLGHMADNEALVKALVAKGADVNAAQDEVGVTALMVAAQMGRLRAVQVLASQGADVNHVVGQWTALVMAAGRGYLDVVQALIDAGADERSNPLAAYHNAGIKGYPEVAAYIEKRFPQAPPDEIRRQIPPGQPWHLPPAE